VSKDLLDQASQAARSARVLQASGDIDGAINRAYYAMFYAAHAALQHRGIEVASSKHGTLVRRFGEHIIKPRLLPRMIGSSLSKALERRQKADYGSQPLTEEDAERAASDADAFIAAVDRLIRG
jgi:uncharacterized protein (UPF0332 family)